MTDESGTRLHLVRLEEVCEELRTDAGTGLAPDTAAYKRGALRPAPPALVAQVLGASAAGAVASVVRGGVELEVPLGDVVEGDLVVVRRAAPVRARRSHTRGAQLAPGDVVPADVRVLECAADLAVDMRLFDAAQFARAVPRSAVVGESRALLEAANVLLFGAYIVRGWARGIAIRAGEQTLASSVYAEADGVVGTAPGRAQRARLASTRAQLADANIVIASDATLTMLIERAHQLTVALEWTDFVRFDARHSSPLLSAVLALTATALRQRFVPAPLSAVLAAALAAQPAAAAAAAAEPALAAINTDVTTDALLVAVHAADGAGSAALFAFAPALAAALGAAKFVRIALGPSAVVRRVCTHALADVDAALAPYDTDDAAPDSPLDIAIAAWPLQSVPSAPTTVAADAAASAGPLVLIGTLSARPVREAAALFLPADEAEQPAPAHAHQQADEVERLPCAIRTPPVPEMAEALSELLGDLSHTDAPTVLKTVGALVALAPTAEASSPLVVVPGTIEQFMVALMQWSTRRPEFAIFLACRTPLHIDLWRQLQCATTLDHHVVSVDCSQTPYGEAQCAVVVDEGTAPTALAALLRLEAMATRRAPPASANAGPAAPRAQRKGRCSVM